MQVASANRGRQFYTLLECGADPRVTKNGANATSVANAGLKPDAITATKLWNVISVANTSDPIATTAEATNNNINVNTSLTGNGMVSLFLPAIHL